VTGDGAQVQLTARQMARMSELLDGALPTGLPARRRWLDALAPGDADLLPALEHVLFTRADEAALGELTLPRILPQAREPGGLAPGGIVGPYVLERELGSGGMADVWLARRADGALRRDVALKIPAAAPSRGDLEQRFERERDILAALDHPHIARFYDAGVTAEGLPWIAMEYVRGESLIRWCDARHIEIRARVALFLQVLDAVAYAHARQVLHRDIKPSNILVTEAGQAQLLDFGVAGLLYEEADPAAITRHFGRPMTPEYASPEQLRGEVASVRSDVYSLGVVLFELLAGERPFGRALSTQALLDHAAGHIPAPDPSTLAGEDAARARDLTRSSLARCLRGDLDAIVRKALSLDPDERYAGPAELARDLRRHLEGEPVQARAGGLPYRAAKALRRHRATVVTTLGTVAVAAAAVSYALWHASAARPAPAPVPAAERGTAPDDRSIAVLPFLDLSERRDQEYFSDGLAEELIDRLSLGRQLRVVARTSSFQFKDRNEDARTIGNRLGVAHLLEGSVRRSGQALRVTAQLVRVADGTTVWSRTYERPANDVLFVQDEIAGSVAQSLSVTLNGGPRSSSAETANAEAYNLLLQGNYVYQRSDRENVERAVGFYRDALALDPRYARAWFGIASARLVQAEFAWGPFEERIRQAREAVDHALALDPSLIAAHRVRATILIQGDLDWEGARAEYDRALDLDPADTATRARVEELRVMHGAPADEWVRLMRLRCRADPLDTDALGDLGWSLYFAGQLDESMETWRHLLRINPYYAGGHAQLAATLVLAGRAGEALAEAEQEKDDRQRLSILPAVYWALGRSADSALALHRLEKEYGAGAAVIVSQMHAFRGEPEEALRWLERGVRERDTSIDWIAVDPYLRNLRSDPRFTALVSRLRLDTPI